MSLLLMSLITETYWLENYDDIKNLIYSSKIFKKPTKNIDFALHIHADALLIWPA